MTIAVMVFRVVYISALAAGLLIAAAGLLRPGGTPQAFAQADTTAPTISSIAITSDTGDENSFWDDDGVYGIGDRIRVTVTFSEDINVTGSPRLELDIGGAAEPAEYESAEGGKVVFGYTVVEGDADNDGIAIGADKLTLNGGSIKDTAGTAADLSHTALAVQIGHRVDGIRPTISNVFSPSYFGSVDGILTPGEILMARVFFSEDILVAGSPRLALDLQGTTKLADLTSVHPKCETLVCDGGSSAPRGVSVSFESTVLEGEEDKDGAVIPANALSLNGGSIEDAAGNDAVLTHGPLDTKKIVDGVPPTISAIAITSDPGDDNSYGVGDQVEVTVTFSENVRASIGRYPISKVASFRPRLMLDIGGKTKPARYDPDSSSGNLMIFTYAVKDGDNDDNGIAVGANMLQLLAAKAYDIPAKNPADITHQALPDDPEHMVSTPDAGTANEESPTTSKSGLVKITGEARVWATLTADPSGIIDDDGIDHAEFFYWWLSDLFPPGVGIFGVHPSPRYEVKPTDAGAAIRVRVSFYDDAGNWEVRFSATVQVPGCPWGEALPVWSADMSVVEYTSVSIGADGSDLFSNVCGSSDFRIRSLWSYTPDRDLHLAFEDPIPNAEDLTLHFSDLALPFPAGSSGQSNFKWADVDVDWEDRQTISVTIVQTPVTVEPQPNTQATGAPTITGTPQVDESLRARTSGIADADGLTNANFAYQWVIGGSERRTRVLDYVYTPDENDVGKTIQVTVTFTDDAGNEETLTSEPTAEVVAKPSEVTITGEARVGETLMANTTGIIDEDGLDNATFHYTWSTWYFHYGQMWHLHSSSEPYYTVGEFALGDFIVVTVTFEDDESNEEERTSSPSTTVKPANNSATGRPTISGEPRVGEPLLADTSGISDPDGLDNAAFSYRWMSSDGTTDTDVLGATASTYAPSANEVGKTIKVRVSFTDAAGNEESLTSDPTGNVAATLPTEPLHLTVTGGSQVQELDASWQPPASDGGSDITGYKVQWKEAAGSWDTDVSESEVTGTTYTITGLTGGVEYAARVVATNDLGDGPASSEATGTPSGTALQQVVEPENTAPTGVPIIDGIPRVGETLTADTSGIDDDDELTNVVFAYQWTRRDGSGDAVITGATGAAYTLVAADEGKATKVTVSFTDDRGNEETLASEPTGAVAPDPGPLTVFTVVDTSTDPDEVLGTLEDGGTLTLGNPTGGEYGIRVDTDSSHDDHDDIQKVVLALSGAKDVSRPEKYSPYSLYGDSGADNLDGGNLPVGSYSLTATAYDANGDVLGTLKVSFTVAAQGQTAVPNNEPTGSPTIDGAARVGETLTADPSGIIDADGLTNVAFSYQWTRSDGSGDAVITGATESTYTLVAADEGKTIKVKVSFTDDAGNEESLTSDPTGAVAPAAGPLAGFSLAAGGTGVELLALVEGVQVVTGEYSATLFAIRANLAAGKTVGSVRFELHRDGENVTAGGGKTESYEPYSLYGDEGGQNLTGAPLPVGDYRLTATAHSEKGAGGDQLGRLEVSFTVVETAPTPADTPAQEPPEPPPNSSATGRPNIGGIARVGETLTADTSGIDDDDGLDSAVFAYQWLRGNAEVAGATGETYTLVEADEGQTVKVKVSFTDDRGNPETLTSDPTGAVAAKPNTRATGQPTIDGTEQVGQTLTADTSDIDDDDGLDSAAFSYQWLRSEAEIPGATGETYTLVAEDESQTVKVKVSFTDGAGNSETLTSDPTGEVEAKPNTRATGAPTIDGIARVGETLTADTSGIDDDDGLDSAAFSYQWLRNDAEIAGATGETYTLVAEDESQTVKVKVSFTDAEGNPETLTSDPTGEVAAAETVPGWPQDLDGKASAQGIALTWTAPDGEAVTEYVVYRGKLQNGSMNGRPMTKHATIGATAADMAYTDAGVEEGQEYRYRVAAVNSAGEGKKSAWINIFAGSPQS